MAERLNILVIDDDAVDRMAVRRALRAAGMDVVLTEAGDAEEGLSALRQHEFHCVLLDYRLPERDGLELLREARATGIDVPVVMLTGQGDEQIAVALMKAGASDYIPKAALNPDRLAQSLWKAVRLHNAEAEARAAQDALRKRVEFEEQLIAIVSHDLRNPISAMIMSAQALLMRQQEVDPAVAKGLQRILSSGRRATRLISDLLDFTQARLGTIPISPRPSDIHEVARQVVDEVSQAHPARRVTFDCDGDGKGNWDPDRLAQIVTNLSSNAVAYSPTDSTVTVHTRGSEERVELSVHNFGTPIAPELLPVLFEPFRRGQEMQPRSKGNIGLGLFIVDRLVFAHGGSIQVTSSLDAGTTFTVHLPRQSQVVTPEG